jgi:hypothetical protein
MALIETFTEDFSNLDNWTRLNSDPNVVFDPGLIVSIFGHAPSTSVADTLYTNDTFDFQGSWYSVLMDGFALVHGPDGWTTNAVTIGDFTGSVPGPMAMTIEYVAAEAYPYLIEVRDYYGLSTPVQFVPPGQFIIGAKEEGGIVTAGYSTNDGDSWTELLSWTYTPPVSPTNFMIGVSFTTDNDLNYSFVFNSLNAREPFVGAPLFENLDEPFDNLDQWTITGSLGAVPVVADGSVVFNVASGQNNNRAIQTVNEYVIGDSWVSFRIKSTGPYPQTVSQIDVGGLTIYALNSYPGSPGLSISVGSNLSTVPTGSQPYVLVDADDDDNVTVYYALDETEAAAGNWVAVNDPEPLTDFNLGSATTMKLGCISFGTPSSSYDIEYDQINQYNLEGAVGGGEPELTEVDAAALSSNWNVESVVSKTLLTDWSQDVPYLRHSTRHLHRTIFEYLEGHLEAMGWTVSGSTPFGAPVVTMQAELPEEWDEQSVLMPGTVALTLGDEAQALNQEMGGPLALIEVPFFVDVFMDTPGTTLALALDIRDIFCGRAPGSTRYLRVKNYNPSTPVDAPGYTMEFDDVYRQNQKKNWETVKITANMYFQDVEGN